MGLFSSISDAISDFAKPIKGLWSDTGLSDVFDIGSTLYGGYQSAFGNSAKAQMELMKYQQQLQNESWKYQMSNRHQFETQDLRNAGLNPILSANSGGSIAAGIPNGSLSDSNSDRANAMSRTAMARQNALQTASLIQTNASQRYLNDANADAVSRNADYNGLRTQADVALSLAHADLLKAQADNARDPFIKYSGAMSTGGALLGAGLGAFTRLGLGLKSLNNAKFLGTFKSSKDFYNRDGELVRSIIQHRYH